jgi:aconitate hydratase A / 2-methylisocitrate dehydratase
MNDSKNSFASRASLQVGTASLEYHRLAVLGGERLPFTIKIMLENLLRHEDGRVVKREDIEAMAAWRAAEPGDREVAFLPARVLLQDFTGVPAVVDLAAMRDAMRHLGGNPKRINPQIPVDLVIDHSVQVDQFGAPGAFRANVDREFERNGERYVFLRWGQDSFENFRVVPPGTGICHQVNLEYLSQVTFRRRSNGVTAVFPDSLVGTDSHTTMVNGVGVFGWGVGGIEAEAVMLGQPYYMVTPAVVGFKLSGRLPAGATATDLVLTVTQILRKKGVVGKFVEFYGSGLSHLSLADRATIANMAPEYGATMGFFPVDEGTLRYLRLSGRPDDLVAIVEAYCKEQGLFRTDATADPVYTDTVELDLGTVEPSLAGPKRPQDRVPLREMKPVFQAALKSAYNRDVAAAPVAAGGGRLAERRDLYADQSVPVRMDGTSFRLTHGSVVIAAITSCTNTSNPSVMLGAGLLAKKAVERGLHVRPWVKTSLAPGSKVVTDYLQAAGLMQFLEQLRFHLVGYGCTTCIGNSGPLPAPIAEAIKDKDLVAAAVLSGNRNFEGRINPLTLANYLASPPLVVAYALAGTVDIDMEHEPLGTGSDGKPVYLRDVWPTAQEIEAVLQSTVKPELFRREYGDVFSGDEAWRALPVPEGEIYRWDASSTYIQEPPFFAGLQQRVRDREDIRGARALAVLGDSVTTDHISPAGSIPVDGPAGRYLIAHGVEPREFNSYGARRGNHEVMMRGTFANIRLRNQLVPGVEGGWTRHLPDGEQMAIYDAAMRYQEEGVPLIVIAGKEYGTGSSRDWAAKGTALLGVRAVIAESYERIHRSNLVGMGVLPLQFRAGESRASIGLTGGEVFDVAGIAAGLSPQQRLEVRAVREDASELKFEVIARIDTAVEVEYYRNGGILHAVLRGMAR